MKWIYALGALGLLAACSTLSPEQTQSVIDAINSNPTLSPEQKQAAIAAATGQGSSELQALGAELLRTGVDVGLALLGVRMWRGGTASRKGSAPTS